MDLALWEAHTRTREAARAVVRRLGQEYQCCSPEPEALFGLSYSLAGIGAILEIGTNVGTSTIALALGQQARRTGRKVHTVDMARHPQLDANLREAGVAAQVEIIVSTSGELARVWTEPLELLWIDGDHSYGGCRADIEGFSRHVVTGGFIALHDFADRMGVPRAVHESILAKPWLFRVVSDREHGSIFVVRKIGSEEARAPWRDEMQPTTQATPGGR